MGPMQMLEERGRGAVLVGVAQQLRPYQPPVVMGFAGVLRQELAG